MTGLVRTHRRGRCGWCARRSRSSVVLVGWLLGGNLGVGTVVFVLAIGPLVQVFLPLLTVGEPPAAPGREVRSGRCALVRARRAARVPDRVGSGSRTWTEPPGAPV